MKLTKLTPRSFNHYGGIVTEHRSHFDGRIQSLSYTRPDGVRVGIGVFQPGTYDVGETDTEERIRITSGTLTINGTIVSEGELFIAPRGTRLVFEVAEPTTYFCTYHK